MFNKRQQRLHNTIIALTTVLGALVVLLFAWTEHSADEPAEESLSTAAPESTADTRQDPVVLAAGDIASCLNDNDEATARIVDREQGTVLALGDTAYERGRSSEFAQCYEPTWGRFKNRTRPVVGNHEYETPGAADYFAYFGDAAGTPSKGYYSFPLGAWHVVALNSNCSQLDGCEENSEQLSWLRQDLVAHPATCTLAYMHHPVFSSGVHGANEALLPLWRTLTENGVDVLLVGHDHHYERFAPMDAAGAADASGLREFIVGTGGRSLYPIVRTAPNSEGTSSTTFGVLKLTLHEQRYDWTFVPAAGATFTDKGSGRCH